PCTPRCKCTKTYANTCCRRATNCSPNRHNTIITGELAVTCAEKTCWARCGWTFARSCVKECINKREKGSWPRVQKSPHLSVTTAAQITPNGRATVVNAVPGIPCRKYGCPRQVSGRPVPLAGMRADTKVKSRP